MSIRIIMAFAVFAALPIMNVSAADHKINIDKAMYGMGTDVDATKGVGKLCNKKTSCSFKVEPKVMSVTDPNPGTKKLLRISWSCGDDGMDVVEMWDYDTVNLSCK